MMDKDTKQHTIDSLMDYWREFSLCKAKEIHRPVNYKHMLLHDCQRYGLIEEFLEKGFIGAANGHRGMMLPMGVKVYFTSDISMVNDIIILTD